MAKKKERERKLENDIFHTGKEIARREELIRVNENTKASAEKEKEGYRSKDERVLKLTEYEKQATKVYERIKQFCERKEKEKKEQLQNAINEIFNEELKVGKKRSHWMWFIFPQIRGLGYSNMAIYYAIESREEAENYITDPTLGHNLIEISTVLLEIKDNDAKKVMGEPDDRKLQS